MYTFERLDKFDEQDVEVLFEASKKALMIPDTDMMDQRLMPGIETIEDLRMWLKGQKSFTGPNKLNSNDYEYKLKCYNGNWLNAIYYCSVDHDEPEYLAVKVCLYNKDQQGSRSWIYDVDYNIAWRDFVVSLGFKGTKAIYKVHTFWRGHTNQQKEEVSNLYKSWEVIDHDDMMYRTIRITH